MIGLNLRAAAVFLAALLSATQPSFSAGVSDIPTEALIDQLTTVATEAPGIDAGATFDSFMAEDSPPKFEGGVLGTPPPSVSPAMRELVRRGLSALPALLHHLDDARPTHLQLGVNNQPISTFGGHEFNDEYDAGASGWICVSGDCDKTAKWFEGSYTVKVGDICFVLVGQIVNRRLLAVRYQPTSILIVNSPVQSAALAGKTREDWEGLTPAAFKASLLSDLKRAKDDRERLAASERLSLYFPPPSPPQK